MGGTGEAKLARDASTLQISQGPAEVDCTTSVIPAEAGIQDAGTGQVVLFNPLAPTLGGRGKERNRGTPSDSRQEVSCTSFPLLAGGGESGDTPDPGRDEPLTFLRQTTPRDPATGLCPAALLGTRTRTADSTRPPILGGPRFVVAVGVGVGYECRAGREKRNPPTTD